MNIKESWRNSADFRALIISFICCAVLLFVSVSLIVKAHNLASENTLLKSTTVQQKSVSPYHYIETRVYPIAGTDKSLYVIRYMHISGGKPEIIEIDTYTPEGINRVYDVLKGER